ncbi:hypothetical protein DACRYDRAFT_99095 [Dacryopinax primogenitus]|uniref:Uncharacterized protein n=1 Tax=Dacryopinax primogenitus (strain DJM 731) TaxID=1858805 RepID=M5GDG9_DACPD|nr:uncharacterized protein DACRYDRAFT_99095 [Dacryopinax primogenitus]EJU04522.1 hypothetical protein DACRYDRAFT_99095 [Dacryopinax primogenitus]
MASPSPTTTSAQRRDSTSLPFRPPDSYSFLSLRWRRAQAEVSFKEVERALKTKLRQDINLKGDDIKKVFEYDVRRDGDSGAWWFRFIVEIHKSAFEHVVHEIGSAKSSNLTLCAEEDSYKAPPPPRVPTPSPPKALELTPEPPFKKQKLSKHSSDTLPALPIIDFPTALVVPSSPPPRPVHVPEDSPWYLAFDDTPAPDCAIFDCMRWDHSRPMLRFVNDAHSSFAHSPSMESSDLPTSPATPMSPVTPLADGTNLPRDVSRRTSSLKRTHTPAALPSLPTSFQIPQPIRTPSLPEMPTGSSLRVSSSADKNPYCATRSPAPPSLPSMPTSTSSYLLPPPIDHPAPEDQFAAQMKKARAGISGSLPGVPRKRKLADLDSTSRAVTPLEGFASAPELPMLSADA